MLPPQYPLCSDVQLTFGNSAGLNGFQYGLKLYTVFRAAQQIISGKNCQNSSFTGTVISGDGAHNKIICYNDTFETKNAAKVGMYSRGQRGGKLRVHGIDYSMADKNGITTGINGHGKWDEILKLKLGKGAIVHGTAGVGICIVSIAGKMLCNSTYLKCVHKFDGPCGKFSCDLGGLSQTAAIEKTILLCGNVTYRSHIYIDAQAAEQMGFFCFHTQHMIHTALVEKRPG